MGLPERCIDLTPAQVVEALSSRAAMRALLSHLARIAKPATGAAKILVPIGRMASNACNWISRGLVVEIGGTTKLTNIDIFVGDRAGRELLFPRLTLQAPVEEFVRAVKLAPQVIFPMKGKLVKEGAVLSCDAKVIGTLPPSAFGVAEAAIRRSLPPKLRQSLAPIDSLDMPADGEAALLERLLPKGGKAPRIVVPKIEDLSGLDADWDAAPPAARASKVPRSPPKLPPRPAPRASKRPKPI